MRISIDRADSGFLPDLVGPRPPKVDVYLDDEPVRDVVTADEEEGLVLVYARDEDGGFHHCDGKLLCVARRGAVRIVGIVTCGPPEFHALPSRASSLTYYRTLDAAPPTGGVGRITFER